MAHKDRVMQGLKQKLDAILQLVEPGTNIALVDEPVHRNIGDHLIQWGAEQFFKQHAMRIVYRASSWDYRSYRARAAIKRGDVIFCQGGGNLGDLYPNHQRLREQVIRDFPNNRIIILPQSVYFVDKKAETQTAEMFQSHRDLHLCLRDHRSLKLANNGLCSATYLLPDMAHALWPLAPKSNSNTRTMSEHTLYLIRRDKEGLGLPAEIHQYRDHFIDWPDLVNISDTCLLALAVSGLAAGNPAGISRHLLQWEAKSLIQRAITTFSPFDYVVTSRLHASLLALLLGKRVGMLETLTGKTGAYHHTWLQDINTCHLLG